MKLDELQEAWKSQDTRTAVEASLLLGTVRKRQRRYSRFIWLRNMREGWGPILAAVLFVCFAESDVASRWQLWPFYLAMAILFGIGVFRVIDTRRQNRKAVRYEDSALSFAERSVLEINHRIWLLENIFWWWILPVAIGGMLVMVQIIMLVGWQNPIVYWKVSQGAGIACAILCLLYWGNQWTARKYWMPRKAELEAIADSLRSS